MHIKSLRLILTVLLISVSLFAENLLSHQGWTIVQGDKARGSCEKLADGSWKVRKDTPEGFLVFTPHGMGHPVTAGQFYEIIWELTLPQGLQANSMVFLPKQPKERTPWPVGTQAIGNGGLVTVTQKLEIEEGETLASVRLVLRGASGTAVIRKCDIRPCERQRDWEWLADQSAWTLFSNKTPGTARRLADGSWEITKKADDGFVVFAVENPLFPVKPQKTYLIEWEVKAAKRQPLNSMVFLPRTPQPRSPWPVGESVSGTGDFITVSQLLNVEPGETSARIQLVIQGKAGTIIVRRCRIREMNEAELIQYHKQNEITEFRFAGEKLQRAWKGCSASEYLETPNSIALITNVNGGGIECQKLGWHAADVRTVEVEVATEACGYLRLDYVTEENGVRRSSYLTASGPATGTPRPYRFLVSEKPSWKGTVREIKIRWNSAKPGKVEFFRIHALPQDNLIPFADDALAVRPLENLRPRGQYRLANAAGSSLVIFDQHEHVISTIDCPNGTVDFTAPELLVRAELRNAAPGASLILRQLRPLELPSQFWHGSWIWCQEDLGPINTTVWFEKKITLDELPAVSQALLTADDQFDFFLNGTLIGSGDQWDKSHKFDLTPAAWKIGENRLIVKVRNVGAWGGFIGDIYLRLHERDTLLPTGADWLMAVGDDQPANIDRPPVVLGPPPAAPWGTRLDYHYIGPRGKVKVNSVDGTACELTVLADIPVREDTIDCRIDGEDGIIRAVVSPDTSQWRRGQTVKVSLCFPQRSFTTPQTVRFASEYFDVQDDAPVALIASAVPRVPELVTARVVNAGTRPYFEIDGKKYSSVYYDGYRIPNKTWMLRDAVSGGNQVIRSTIGLDQLWPSRDTLDFSCLEQLMDNYELYAPEVKVILTVKLGMPIWWCKENPDDILTYDKGQPINPAQDRQALASQKWLREASVILRQLIAHIKTSRYADRIFALGLAEGWNCEWFWTYSDANGKPAVCGYSKADYDTFRTYLREQYKTDEALARAWNTPGLTFDTIVMPTMEELNSTHALQFQNVELDRRTIDWFAFHNRALREAIETFGKVVKDETDGKWLVGVYYGYFVMMSSIYRRLQSVGHLAFEELARSPYVDIFWAPSDYRQRPIGLPDGVMQAAEALTSHGKLVVVEKDMRTFSENDHYEASHRKCTVEQTIGAMDRALGMMLARGLGIHWMAMHDSWWREKVLLIQMKIQHDMLAALPDPTGTTPVEICLVSDQDSTCYTRHNHGENPHLAVIYKLLENMAYAGVPYRHVMVKDLLEDGIVPQTHKFYIMTNLYALPKPAWDALFARLRREKATVLWLYAAGVSDASHGPDVNKMSDTLGITFRRVDDMRTPTMTLVPELGGSRLVNGITSGPWFYPVSGFEQILAKDDDGNPMMVAWQRDGVHHLFSVLMNPTTDLLRTLFARAGIHLYTPDATDSLHVGNDVVFLNAKIGGRKQLLLPAGCRAKAIAGPITGDFGTSPAWNAVPGRSYGFLIERTNP